MQAVLGLVPHRRLRAVDHLRRHLIAAMGGQAMHEDRILVRGFAITAPSTWKGRSAALRRFASLSPIDTQTSVTTQSAPRAA